MVCTIACLFRETGIYTTWFSGWGAAGGRGLMDPEFRGCEWTKGTSGTSQRRTTK